MQATHPRRVPNLVFANAQGEILDYEGLLMAGRSGYLFIQPRPEELIPLPEGSELFLLPARLPVGIEPDSGEPALLETDPYDSGRSIQAVAAFMAPAHTVMYTAAYQSRKDAPILPLFAYTAVGWLDGRFWVAGFRSDPDCRQDIDQFDDALIRTRTEKTLRRFPDNRLIQHLGTCCLTYGCPAARNYFLGRWEAPLPTSPVCNASCVGCISLQPSGCCPAAQERIRFVPSVAELADIAIPHLSTKPRPIVSFGQGCEGEPLLQAETIERAIHTFRTATQRGTINLNTNGGLPDKVERLARAGLDSIRISLNSSRPEYHHRYYRSKQFTFAHVRQSMRIMKRHGRHLSLNYFILPGFTDDPEEFSALSELIAWCQPDLIQLRNLNMDPEYYLRAIGHTPSSPPMGIATWLAALKDRFPTLRFGYFNPALA